MGIDRGYVLQPGPLDAHKTVPYLYDLLSHDVVLVLREKVVNLAYNAGCGILYGKDGVVCAAVLQSTEGILEAVNMKAVNLPAKVLLHGHLGIGTLGPLIAHPGLLDIQTVYWNKRKTQRCSLLRKLLVLEFPAHGHDLGKELLHTHSVKVVVGQRLDGIQLDRLPLLVQHLLACGYLKIRHL